MNLRPIVLCAALLAFGGPGCGGDPGTTPPPSGNGTCASDKDCTSGNVCCSAYGNTCMPASACTPPAPTCAVPSIVAGTGTFPPQAPTSCQKPVQQSAFPSTQLQTFSTQAIGKTIQFSVAPGTGSVSIVQQAVNATDFITYKFSSGKTATIENSVVPLSLYGPDGGLLYDDNRQPPPDPSTDQVFYGGTSASTGVMTLPNATPLLAQTLSAQGLPAGTWKFVVNDFAAECAASGAACVDGGTTANTYDIQVVTKMGLATKGALDVNFYVVATSSTLTAASAPASPAVQRMVQTLAGIYQNAGICVGKVTFYDVPQWARNAYGTSISGDRTAPCDPLDQMFTLSQPGNAINFFLVQSISSTANAGGGRVVGIDGTIPGPSGYGGTVHSGAAVSLANLGSTGCTGGVDVANCGPDEVAYIAAHEGGHFLGLYHTTEQEGENFDPLTDTGTCKCDTCAPATQQSSCNTPNKTTPPTTPTIVHANSCVVSSSCAGGDNLMFWELSAGVSRGTLSTQQSQVMRLNPVIQ